MILKDFMMCKIAENKNNNVYFHSDEFLEEIKLVCGEQKF